MSILSKNLRYLRKLSGLSQEAFAKKVGLNRGNIASYEKAAAEPSIENLLKITRFLNIDLVDFLDKNLEEVQIQNRIEVKTIMDEVVAVEVGHESLKELFEDYVTEDTPASVQVHAQRLLNLRRIIQGFKEYHRFRIDKHKNPSPELQAIILDYDRLLEISDDAIDIGRQLLSKFVK